MSIRSTLVCRPAIASTLIALQPGWPSQPQYSAELAARLAADVAVLVDSGTAANVAACRRFLGFSSCIAAICRVSAQASGGIFSGEKSSRRQKTRKFACLQPMQMLDLWKLFLFYFAGRIWRVLFSLASYIYGTIDVGCGDDKGLLGKLFTPHPGCSQSCE